ncbi:hypothetical protein CRYUN_Cryun06bG0037000 [Craigia yunnanensis]
MKRPHCLLQSVNSYSDPDYIGIRRFLLDHKAESGFHRRLDWRCNGKGYVAYRNYTRRTRNWENLQIPSHSSTPENRVIYWLMHQWVMDFNSTSTLPFVRVTVLKFGHMSSDLLAYGASDGTLTVCAVSNPPSVIKQLKGHLKDVTDFDFLSNNQYFASSTMDKTVQVNNNCLSVGNANKEITVFNFSTGRIITKSVFDSEVTSMDHDHAGQLIFCGYAQVSLLCIYVVIRVIKEICVALEIQGYLTLHCLLKLSPRIHSFRASFCPLLSLDKGEYIVAGSEDSNVYFYDLTRPRHTCVNKLRVLLSCVLVDISNSFANLQLTHQVILVCKVMVFQL